MSLCLREQRVVKDELLTTLVNVLTYPDGLLQFDIVTLKTNAYMATISFNGSSQHRRLFVYKVTKQII